MSSNWTQRLTLGIACVALFIAAGGPGYAASKISGSKIKTNSIPANRLTSAARASLKGKVGVQGVPGAQGSQGPQGPQGPQGSSANIGAGSVGSNEVADGSLRTVDFAVAKGTMVADLPSLAANNCNFTNARPAGVLATDHVIVTPAGTGPYAVSGDLIVTGVINQFDAAVEVKICNPTTSAIDPPNETFKYVVLR
jgi:hypothetical protein